MGGGASFVLYPIPGSVRDARFRLDSAWKAVFVLVPTGNPPSLRFGHPDVTFGRYRLSALGYCAGAAAFSGCALRVSAGRSQPHGRSVPVHLPEATSGYPLGCFPRPTRPGGEATPSGSALRVSHGCSPQRSEESAEHPCDGCPCVGAEEVCSEPPQEQR